MLNLVKSMDCSPMEPAAVPLIQATGLRKSYGKNLPVLKSIDLEIRTGERVALIGSNGSGKSTLLKCLIGLHETSGGTLSTLGEDFSHSISARRRARVRQQTGFVFQKHCLVRRRSVLSNVIHGMYGEKGSWRAFSHTVAMETWRNKAIAALEEVNLAEKAMERADTLSGGQQQRVAIARALIKRPRLLIADEPAASLDPVSGKKVMDLFSTLCTHHDITLLFTSHDMEHALEYADRIIALKDGLILFDAQTQTITDAELNSVFYAQ